MAGKPFDILMGLIGMTRKDTGNSGPTVLVQPLIEWRNAIKIAYGRKLNLQSIQLIS
jgi:hypothetical protein